MIPEDAVRAALAHPQVMVGSDGVPLTNGGGHPRGVGTYARVLGRYVREQKVLDLMTALGKISLMVAQRLEPFVPAMGRKGRIAVGADADVTVFDPGRVIDRATYEKPAQYSEGIRHVIVGGTFVVRDEHAGARRHARARDSDRESLTGSEHAHNLTARSDCRGFLGFGVTITTAVQTLAMRSTEIPAPVDSFPNPCEHHPEHPKIVHHNGTEGLDAQQVT